MGPGRSLQNGTDEGGSVGPERGSRSRAAAVGIRNAWNSYHVPSALPPQQTVR